MSGNKLLRYFTSLLRESFEVLRKDHQLTSDLESLISRDFDKITHREAYELLWFLLVACGIKFNKSHMILNYIDSFLWSNLKYDTKSDVEKFKTHIIQALKDLSQSTGVDMKLEKSILKKPNSLKFLKCTVCLVNTALSKKLENIGVNLPHSVEFNNAKGCGDKIQQSHDVQYFESVQNKLLKELEEAVAARLIELESIIREINVCQERKKNLFTQLEEKMENCPPVFKEDTNNYSKIVANWSKYVHGLPLSDGVRLYCLRRLYKNIADINSLIINEDKRLILEENLFKLLSPEIRKLIDENEILEITGNRICLKSLTRFILDSIPRDTLQEKCFDKFLELRAPVNNYISALEKSKLIYENIYLFLQVYTPFRLPQNKALFHSNLLQSTAQKLLQPVIGLAPISSRFPP